MADEKTAVPVVGESWFVTPPKTCHDPVTNPVLDHGALLAQRFMARSTEALLIAARTIDLDARAGVYDVAKRYARMAYEELERMTGEVICLASVGGLEIVRSADVLFG